MKYSIVEVVVGLVVILAAGLFVYEASSSVDSVAGDRISLTAKVADAGAIRAGTDVRMAGVKVGYVTSVALDPKTYFAEISMEMTDTLVIPTDSTLKIASEGLLGGNFLTIEVGGSEEQLQSGDEFEYTQGAVDLMSLIGQAVFSGKE